MSDDQQGTVQNATDGGVSGTHPPAKPLQFLVGSTTANEQNLARLGLIPIACWKVEDIRFAFDSSFVTPDVATEIQQLQALREQHKKTTAGKGQYPPISLFGHADPVGTDDYNKALSGRRATAIYAVLIVNSNPDTAVSLWQQISGTENWGAQQQQTMQATVPAGTSDSDLLKTYMQQLCPASFQLTPQDFLAQGADPQGKGDYQGCSSFNPILIFSQQTETQYEQAEQNQDQATLQARNAANAPNRRVMGLLFNPGSQIVPAKWPCPSATGDKSGCIKRFWSDGQKRRQTRLPNQDRKFDDKKDTFACRFYQRLLTDSPCETVLQIFQIKLFDMDARPIPSAPCLVTEQGKAPRPDRASGDAFITLRDLNLPATVNVKWSRPNAGDGASSPPPAATDKFEFAMDVAIDIPEADPKQAALTRLKNLGYITVPNLFDPIRAFQYDYQKRFADLQVDGQLNTATTNAIQTVHDACDPVLKWPKQA